MTVSRTTASHPASRARSKRTRLSVLAAAGLVALTGCASLHPGAAAVVGDSTITHDDVDDLAGALCSANIANASSQGQAAPDLATRGAREGALQVLVDTTLSEQFGESEGVEADPKQVSTALAQNEQGVALLPPSQREGFRTVLRNYAEAQLMLIEVGRASLGESGKSDATDDQAFAEGQRLRASFVKGLDVEVDPRYGTFTNGGIQRGTSSLSVPASDSALAGNRAEPAPDFVSTLPATQKCS